MKSISFIRHAKSPRPANVPDFERKLNERGMTDAPIMGKVISEEFIAPDLIISSSAKRAEITSRLIAKELNYPEEKIQFLDDLYFADTETYMEIISELDSEIKHIYIVSHNPGTTDIVNRISNARLDNMPTCGIAQIGFKIDEWKEIYIETGKLLNFDRPKNHR